MLEIEMLSWRFAELLPSFKLSWLVPVSSKQGFYAICFVGLRTTFTGSISAVWSSFGSGVPTQLLWIHFLDCSVL